MKWFRNKMKWFTNIEQTVSININKQYITYIHVDQVKFVIRVHILGLDKPIEFIANDLESLWQTVEDLKEEEK